MTARKPAPARTRATKDRRLQARLARQADALEHAEEHPFGFMVCLPYESLMDLSRRLRRVSKGEDARLVFGQGSVGAPSKVADNRQRAWTYFYALAEKKSAEVAARLAATCILGARSPTRMTIERNARRYHDVLLEMDAGERMFPNDPPLDYSPLLRRFGPKGPRSRR